jgi:hypothetical protein
MKWLCHKKIAKTFQNTDNCAKFLGKNLCFRKDFGEKYLFSEKFKCLEHKNVRKMNMITASRPENPVKTGSYRGGSKSSHSFQAAQKTPAYFLFCVIWAIFGLKKPSKMRCSLLGKKDLRPRKIVLEINNKCVIFKCFILFLCPGRPD